MLRFIIAARRLHVTVVVAPKVRILNMHNVHYFDVSEIKSPHKCIFVTRYKGVRACCLCLSDVNWMTELY